ncbi:MAG: response regulator, partial [Methylococcaceae bacterium]
MKKILVIEDERALVEVLRDELTLHNFDVVVAYNGEEAMKQMRAELPDFILLDLLLPRKDGFEILQEKQKDKTIRDIPVLVLSNLGQGDDVERA